MDFDKINNKEELINTLKNTIKYLENINTVLKEKIKETKQKKSKQNNKKDASITTI